LYIIALPLASAPLPPPRKKPQEASKTETPASPSTTSRPEPKPRPKPRPDRISVDNLIANEPAIIKPQAEVESTKQSISQPTLSIQLRNPLARYGVKVLPDNVVKERTDRLAKQASLESVITPDSDNRVKETPKKTVTPAPHISKPNAALGIHKSSNGSDITNRKEDSDSSSSSVPKSKPPPPPPNLSKSDYTGKGSVRSIQNLNEKLGLKSSKVQEDVTEYDSDNLEENIEFFELPSSSKPKITSSGESNRLMNMKASTKSNSVSKRKPGNEPKSAPISSQASSEMEQGSTPKPKPNLIIKTGEKSPKVKAFSSLSGVTLDSSEDRMDEVDVEVFTEEREKSSKQLNRWQNSVSLHEIDSLASNNATNTKTVRSRASSAKPGKFRKSSSEDYGRAIYFSLDWNCLIHEAPRSGCCFVVMSRQNL
jgi:hypothetical protein